MNDVGHGRPGGEEELRILPVGACSSAEDGTHAYGVEGQGSQRGCWWRPSHLEAPADASSGHGWKIVNCSGHTVVGKFVARSEEPVP